MSFEEVLAAAGTISAMIFGAGGLALQIFDRRKRPEQKDGTGSTGPGRSSVLSSALLLFGLTLGAVLLAALMFKSEFAWWALMSFVMIAFNTLLGAALASSVAKQEAVSPMLTACGYLVLACGSILVIGASLLMNEIANSPVSFAPETVLITSGTIQAVIAPIFVVAGVLCVKGHSPGWRVAVNAALFIPLGLLMLGILTITEGAAAAETTGPNALIGGILPIGVALMAVIAVFLAFQPSFRRSSHPSQETPL